MLNFVSKLIALLLVCTCAVVHAEPDSAQQLDSVRSEIKALSADLSAQKSSREELYAQLKQQSRNVSDLNRKLRELQQQIQQKDSELNSLRDEMGIKEKQQTQQLEALYAQIRAAFINAEPSYLEMLLNQQDIATISRGSTYFRYFHQARESQIDQINTLLSQLNEEQKSVLLAQQSLETLLDEQKQQQVVLQQETDKRQATLAALDKKISGKSVQLATLQEEEKNLQQLLESLARQEAKRKEEAKKALAKAPTQKTVTPPKPNTPFSRLTGKLNWPVSGKVLARYGSPRNLGKLQWKGIVIASPTGNEVRATASGKVVFADWLRGFGLLIIIDHGEQYMTLYGNNESLLREAGDVVQAGDTIAQSGEQGIRGLAGLYFEIRHRGSPTNPLKWLGKQG